MAKIKVRRLKLSEAELAELTALLVAAGYGPDEIELVDDEDGYDPWDQILAVLLTNEVCNDPALEAALMRMQAGGGRAICVWPSSGANEAPLSVDKYAFSVVHWDPASFAKVTTDNAVPCFEEPDGEPREEPETERHECE